MVKSFFVFFLQSIMFSQVRWHFFLVGRAADGVFEPDPVPYVGWYKRGKCFGSIWTLLQYFITFESNSCKCGLICRWSQIARCSVMVTGWFFGWLERRHFVSMAVFWFQRRWDAQGRAHANGQWWQLIHKARAPAHTSPLGLFLSSCIVI